MSKPSKVCKDLYIVGGSDISHPYDCSVYLLDAGDLALIDAGLAYYRAEEHSLHDAICL